MSDDAKETQLQELEALESIFTDELDVLCRDYPSICLEVTVPALNDSELFTLRTTLPSKYPNEVPKIEVIGLYDKEDFWGDSSSKIHKELRAVAEENLEMPMVFTLVSSLQEIVARLDDERTAKTEEVEREKKEKEDKIANPHFEAVSRVEFEKWQKSFVEEMRAKREAEIKAKEALLANRLTGKQLFLADDSLVLSDLQIINSTEQDVEIDEALFEDDISLSEEED